MANFNLNKVILGGRMCATPELKATQNGISVTAFSMAVNRRPGKDKQIEVDFVNVVAWREAAEFICKYFKKGSSICITGSIHNRKWDDNGVKRTTTEVVVDDAYFVDSKAYMENESEALALTNQKEAEPTFEELGDEEGLPF